LLPAANKEKEKEMKKFHVHMGVKDLETAIAFYSALFGEKPVKEKTDYAKWEPEDSELIFAVSTRAQKLGVDHLGLRVDSKEELEAISERLRKANLGVYDEGETTCCYAKSEKAWVEDPTGMAWEAYQNMQDANVFHEAKESDSACCTPAPLQEACCSPVSTGAAKSACC
jgi:catechol 2,3-dioxygenase-like lactoylglutathione lyase family enzyme